MEKVKVILLSCIKRGQKNTRFLIKYDGKYASVKLPADLFYELGSEIEISENKINDRKFDPKWEKNYLAWANTKRKILNHLSKYKKDFLGIPEDGFWEDKDGNRNYYSHILPEKKEDKNIIDSVYSQSIKKLKKEKESEIHKGFRCLNSSQAFAFNFFQPIIDANLFPVLIGPANHILDYDYERKNKEDTQFDFYLKADNKEYSFEVKYTEEDFGPAPMDETHIKKWNSIYKNKMSKILKKEMKMEDFFDEYQLWRNICFAAEGMNVRFVFPKFRDDLSATVNNAKDLCKEEIQKKIDIIIVDDIVSDLKDLGNKDIFKHYSQFEQKYLLIGD